MIGYLVGKPVVQAQSLLLITQQVGYEVLVSSKVLSAATTAESLELFIYTHVREEALDLYGFLTQEDKELFKLLLSVSGVGPKTALGIVEYGGNRIINAVQNADVSLFASVPRVGKKLAQKIIIELKSKLGSLKELNLGPRSTHEQSVVEALQALGFSDTESEAVLTQLEITDDMDVAVIVKKAIKLMGQPNS